MSMDMDQRGIDEARAGFLFFFLQPLLAFFFLLMAVARAKPGLHVNHGRRGGWSTGSPPAGFVAAASTNSATSRARA